MKVYTSIYIRENQYLIGSCNYKSEGGALNALSRIEEIMRKGLQCAKNENLSQTELFSELKRRAELIRDRYMAKAARLCVITRLFGRVGKKEAAVQARFDRIVDLAEPPRLFNELPAEISSQIFSCLSVREMGFAALNKEGDCLAKRGIIERAQEYGYQGNDFADAKNYLQGLFRTVRRLVEYYNMPEKYVVRRGRLPNKRFVDSEATLKNIENLTPEEAGSVKPFLNRAFKVLLTDRLPLLPWNKKLIQILLDCGADPNLIISDYSAHNPLTYNTSDPEMIAYLCKKGANVNFQSRAGNCALHFAAQKNQIETAKVLLQHGANPDVFNNKLETPLMLTGSKKLFKLLLDYGADPNMVNSNGHSLLTRDTSNPEVIRWLCEKGANVNYQNTSSGDCALHYAVKKNQIETARVLLQHGADPNLKTIEGLALLHWAVKQNKKGIIDLLVQSKANLEVEDDEGQTPLMLAIKYKHWKTAKRLIRAGADLTAINFKNSNLLMYTIEYLRSKKVVRFLLDHVRINQANHDGSTALHFAAEKKKGIVDLLVQSGAKLEIKDNNGFTPLALAVKKGYKEAAKRLIRAGADTNVKNNLDSTLLILAIANPKSKKVVRLLLKHGASASIDHTNQIGYTALHYAVEVGNLGKVKLLVKSGANLGIKNKDGLTPRELAVKMGHKEIAKILA